MTPNTLEEYPLAPSAEDKIPFHLKEDPLAQSHQEDAPPFPHLLSQVNQFLQMNIAGDSISLAQKILELSFQVETLHSDLAGRILGPLKASSLV